MIGLGTVLLAAWAVPGPAAAPGPHAVRLTRIDAAPVAGAVGGIGAPVRLRGVLIYPAFDDTNLYGLWASDGASSRTLLARVYAWELVSFREEVFFIGIDSAGTRLWASDGSPAGTRPIADLGEGTAGFGLTAVDGLLYLAGGDGRPRRSDGTPQGTLLLSDAAVLTAPSTSARTFVSLGNAVYFLASADGRMGLWSTSGAPASTGLVADMGSAEARFAYGLASHRERLYFFAAEEAWGARYRIWSSDGTAGGTAPLRTFVGTFGGVCPGQCFGIGPAELPWNGQDFLFVADDGVHGRELWHSDGTTAGTALLADMDAGPGSGAGSFFMDPASTGYADSYALFVGRDDDHGEELWRTDGTAAGTFLVADLVPGPNPSYPYGFVAVDDRIFFGTADAIWRTDGTAGGTSMVRDGGAALSTLPGGFAARAADGLWESDGATFALIDDLARPRGLQPVGLAALGADVVFSRLQNNAMFELWRADRTGDARLLRRFAALTTIPALAGPSMYFGADDGAHGAEPWVTDGTEPGTRMLKDIAFPVAGALGAVDSNPQGFTAAGGRVFFAAGDGEHGYELWSSDGTDAGTRLVRDFEPGFGGSVPQDLTPFHGELAFTIAYPQPGGLWRTNGDSNGTDEVAAMAASGLVGAGEDLYFVGDEPGTGSELWKSDGTPGGTAAVRDITPGPGGTYIYGITAAAGRIFFQVQVGSTLELWTSDGTPTGTRRLGEFRAIEGLTAGASVLYFAADDGAHGLEPWTSDGTPEGTRMIVDLSPGRGGSSPSWVTALGDRVVFAADDGEHGVEPWVSDGTDAGTRMLDDLSPGPASSEPAEFRRAGETVYFRASDEETGAQLWSIPAAAFEPGPREIPRPTRVAPPRN